MKISLVLPTYKKEREVIDQLEGCMDIFQGLS
jgi:hypothetical protein